MTSPVAVSIQAVSPESIADFAGLVDSEAGSARTVEAFNNNVNPTLNASSKCFTEIAPSTFPVRRHGLGNTGGEGLSTNGLL
jgi:hypothetical protein